MKKALITGVTGQDGAYLAKHLLEQDYAVHGTFRRSSSTSFWRLDALNVLDHPNLSLHAFDLADSSSAFRLVQSVAPDEVYNLAAQSFVGVSFDQPISTAAITGMGALNLLEAIRCANLDCRFYQASSSEMFGKVQATPQRETTEFHPRSPYGVAKLFAHWATVNYRESYGLFGASGVLFNHESPLRGIEFVTRKITRRVAEIKLGKAVDLELGNLDAQRDWGFAGDFVRGMHLILQQPEPDTYVLATGRTTTVREFATMAFACIGIELEFEGSGESEIGVDRESGQIRIKVNPEFYRPAEVDVLLGDASKAQSQLNWTPKVFVDELCQMMVKADIDRVANGQPF